MLLNQVLDQDGKRLYSVQEVEAILDSVKGDLTSRQDIEGAKQV